MTQFVLELLVVLGALAIGARVGGVGLGLWGGVGLARPGLRVRGAADDPADRRAAHRAHRHHGRVGDGSGGRHRFPRARRGEDHPQESEAGHDRRAAGDVWLHLRRRHGAHRLSAAAGDLRSGARERHPARAPDGHRDDRFAAGHHREPGVRGDGGDDRPARDARRRVWCRSSSSACRPRCSPC